VFVRRGMTPGRATVTIIVAWAITAMILFGAFLLFWTLGCADGSCR
jgi:hypothetical protein